MIDSPRFYLDKSKKNGAKRKGQEVANSFDALVLNVEFDFRLYLKNQQQRKERERKIVKQNFAAETESIVFLCGKTAGVSESFATRG
jgi:hypothetical protein